MYEAYKFFNNWVLGIIILISFCVYLNDIFVAIRDGKKESTIFYFEGVFGNRFSYLLCRAAELIFVLFVIIASLCSNAHFLVKMLNAQDMRLMSDGTYCYYVEATNEKGQTYTLPAHISKVDGQYNVNCVYFSNGGYLYFDNMYDSSFNDIVKVEDQDNKKWTLVFTNEKAFHPKVQETGFSAGISTYIYYFIMLVHIIQFFRQLCNVSKSTSSNKNNHAPFNTYKVQFTNIEEHTE